MAAVSPLPRTFTGTAHFSGRKVLAEIDSKRLDAAASAAPRNATHKVRCCTKTVEPGTPLRPV
jgi:hypothetical protein